MGVNRSIHLKTIGMIGGVSWESTALYYKMINEAVRDHFGGLNSAKLVISSLNYCPIVELEQAGHWDKVGEILAGTAKSLEKAGAEFVILGCNTLHKISSVIESAIDIPFLHIADPVGEAMKNNKIKKVGLLGTQFTMKEGFYSRRLQEKFNLEVITPEESDRKILDSIIYNELCRGKVIKESQINIYKMIDSLAKSGAKGIILGCTELGMIVNSVDLEIPTYDTIVLHVKKAFELSIDS